MNLNDIDSINFEELTLNDKQVISASTNLNHQGDINIARVALGLPGETGEVCETMKKYLRGDFDKKELRSRMLKELGDLSWYIDVIAFMLGIKSSDIAKYNAQKLAKRKAEGKIKGDGEER